LRVITLFMASFNVNDLLKSAFQDTEKVVNIKELFEEKLKEYDLSKTKALSILNIDKDVFEDILSGTAKQPSIINILKIAQFIDVDLTEVVTAIIKNQSIENIAAIERSQKVTFAVKFFDIKKLSKLGFFEESDDIDYLVNRILTFFGYESISEFEDGLASPLYSKSKKKFSDKMKDFWIKSAYQCFKSINNPNDYNREALKDLIVKAKPYCQDIENGLFTVCKALYNIGITIIIQNQLANTQVRGGTFVVNGKPCIVITDLFKKYPTLWTTLIHELHHVLYDLDLISSTQFHLTGDPDLFLIEEKADEFAMEYFCGLNHFNYIKSHINNPYVVSKFAKELEVHPSFIYSSFRYFQESLYKKNYYGAFIDFFPPYSLAINKLNPITWKENSLLETANKIKTIFELNI
jgi:HTH-type transcriptional regulator / antitoxin HigA